MSARILRQSVLAFPGIGVALLPKLACPLCWPAYAGVLSSFGLGFLISATYLLPITIAFLILTLIVLVFRAKRRRGYLPFGFGLIGAAPTRARKCRLGSAPAFHCGIVILV